MISNFNPRIVNDKKQLRVSVLKTIKFIVVLSVLFFQLSGCLKIGEYYVGLNLQPDTSETPPLQGLNVYGVLKVGPSLDTLNHYFEVQGMMDVLNFEEDINEDSAKIELSRITSNHEKTDYVLALQGEGVYLNPEIVVEPGDRWNFNCSRDSFIVSATCWVPNIPILKSYSLQGNTIHLEIQKDTTAHMYRYYVIDGENYTIEQQVVSGDENMQIDIRLDWETQSEQLLVYVLALDQNLRTYQTTSNTFFKPNAYRPSFSTVDGGYGTFGAVSSMVFTARR